MKRSKLMDEETGDGSVTVSENGDSTIPKSNTVIDSAEYEELKKIEEVLQAADVSGGTMRLERKGPGDLKWQFLSKMKVEDFNFDQIRNVYGGGDYRAQTYKSNGSFYKRFEFAIDYRFKGSMDVSAIQPENRPAADTERQLLQQNSNRSMMDMFTQSQGQATQNMTMMMAMMQESSKQQMTMMVGMFQTLAAAIGKPQTDPSSAYMPLMLEMVKSHGGGNKSESSITEIISAVRDLNALAKGEAPPKEEKEEDMLDKVFKYGGPILTALMTRQPLQMPGAVQPVQADIGPVGGGRVIDVPSSVNGAAQRPVDAEAKLKREVVEKINSYMELLIMAAERQSEPASYAQMISDMLPDEHFDTLIGELKAPDWFSKLTGGNPRIIAQQAWFTQLRQILIEVDQSSDESATTTQSNASAGQAEAGNG